MSSGAICLGAKFNGDLSWPDKGRDGRGEVKRERNAHGMPAVVLAGVDSYMGIQTARILAKRGVTVAGVAADPRSAYCRTKALSTVVRGSPDDQSLDFLVQVAKQFDDQPVFLPCSDQWVLTASRRRDLLEPHFRMVMPSAKVVEMLMDKSSFYEFARSQGFPVMPFGVVRSPADVASVSTRLRFPAIVKPTRRSDRWAECAGQKAVRVESSDELHRLVERCDIDGVDVVVQAWIEGTDSDLVACNLYRDRSGQTQVTFVTRKIRQYPPLTGQACMAEEARADDLLELTESVFQAAGHHGIGYLEWKRDARDGQYYIIEPTVWRPPGRSPITEAAGVEFLYTAYCDAAGLPLPSKRTQTYGDAKWIYLSRDLMSAWHYVRTGELSLREWWASVRGPKYFALFSWKEPIPFLLDIPQTFLRARRRSSGS